MYPEAEIAELTLTVLEQEKKLQGGRLEAAYAHGRRDALRGEIAHLRKLGTGGSDDESESDPATRLN